MREMSPFQADVLIMPQYPSIYESNERSRLIDTIPQNSQSINDGVPLHLMKSPDANVIKFKTHEKGSDVRLEAVDHIMLQARRPRRSQSGLI